MTSILFTVRSEAVEAIVTPIQVARCRPAADAWVCLSAAHACGFDPLLRSVFRGRLFHHLANQGAITAHPIGSRLPLLAVPLLEAHKSAAAMVSARHFDRRHHRAEAEFVEAVLIERQVLDAPAYLLSVQGFLAEF